MKDNRLSEICGYYDSYPRSKPTLQQTTRRFVLIGNPALAYTQPNDPVMEDTRVKYAPNRNPGGQAAIADNPNVTSGGGSIPKQDYFVNGGIQDQSAGLSAAIGGLLQSSPERSALQKYNQQPRDGVPDFQPDCNCDSAISVSPVQSAQADQSTFNGFDSIGNRIADFRPEQNAATNGYSNATGLGLSLPFSPLVP